MTEKSKISADKTWFLKRDYLCIYRKEDKGILASNKQGFE